MFSLKRSHLYLLLIARCSRAFTCRTLLPLDSDLLICCNSRLREKLFCASEIVNVCMIMSRSFDLEGVIVWPWEYFHLGMSAACEMCLSLSLSTCSVTVSDIILWSVPLSCMMLIIVEMYRVMLYFIALWTLQQTFCEGNFISDLTTFLEV